MLAQIYSAIAGAATPIAIVISAVWIVFAFLSQERAKRKELFHQRQMSLIDRLLKDIARILFSEDRTEFDAARSEMQVLLVQEAQIFLDDGCVSKIGGFLSNLQMLNISHATVLGDRKTKLLPAVAEISEAFKGLLSQYWDIEGEARGWIDKTRKFLLLEYKKSFKASSEVLAEAVAKLL